MLVVSVESCLRTEFNCSSKNLAANMSSLKPSVSSTPSVSDDWDDLVFE